MKQAFAGRRAGRILREFFSPQANRRLCGEERKARSGKNTAEKAGSFSEIAKLWDR
jgi:hypothetical protein